MRSPSSCSIFAILIFTLLRSTMSLVTCFAVPSLHATLLSSRRVDNRLSLISCWAKSKRGTASSGGSAAAGGGGGFGSGSTSKNKSTGNKNEGKVRTIKGKTGSAGTKPLRVAANTFDSIRKKYGKECTSDIYVRSPLNDRSTFWFVGKIARRLDLNDANMVGASIPTEVEACVSQKRLILEYAKNELRPQNFGGPYAKDLELWLAPGDSEMDVVQNKVSLVKVVGSTADISDTFAVADVGYNPEIYVGDEIKDGGLRVVRDEEGKPVKPAFDINV